MKRYKLLYTLIAVILLGAAAYFYFGSSATPDIKFRTARLERGPIRRIVRATGTLNPVTTVQVGSQLSGTIAKLFVDFNSTVKAGQIVAQIDNTFLKAALAESQANLERAAAQRKDAERTFNRMKELASRSLVSQAELDGATSIYEQARASEKQTRAGLDRARVNLRYATITAPVSGTVISRNVDVGQTVAASLSAPTIFTIAKDLRQMNILASIDEADIGAIKHGQTVDFTVDAYASKKFHGTVSQVRLAPLTVQNVVTYTVVVDVNNDEMLLKPGMTTTLSVEIDRRDDVLRLPMAALKIQLPDSAKTQSENRSRGSRTSSVYIIDNNVPRKVIVTLGINDGITSEVTDSTLSEGQEVIIGIEESGVAPAVQQRSPLTPQQPGGGGRRGGF